MADEDSLKRASSGNRQSREGYASRPKLLLLPHSPCSPDPSDSCRNCPASWQIPRTGRRMGETGADKTSNGSVAPRSTAHKCSSDRHLQLEVLDTRDRRSTHQGAARVSKDRGLLWI